MVILIVLCIVLSVGCLYLNLLGDSALSSSTNISFHILNFFQALYFCVPFREQLLEYYSNYKNGADAEENLLICLADLFTQVKALLKVQC